MKAFTALYTALDETNKTNENVEALTRYFASADPADAAWALYFLIGRRPRGRHIDQNASLGDRGGGHSRLAVRRVL